MPLLRRAGVGAFKHLRDNPLFQEIPVPLFPSGTKDLRWEGGTAQGSGWRSYVEFALPADLDVGGIRIRYLHSNPKGTPPLLWVDWRGGDQQGFSPDRREKYSPTGDRANWRLTNWLRLSETIPTMTTWVCGKVRHIRIHPDSVPCALELKELTLLVPGPGPGQRAGNSRP